MNLLNLFLASAFKTIIDDKKAVWISFDFGLKGDYTGLYTWLDNQNAVECGNGLAFFMYKSSQLHSETDGKAIINLLSADLKEAVNLSKTDRVYIIIKDSKTNKVKGEFINGTRRQSPWEGYGKLGSGKVVDSEE
jgi:hypothetical protein